MSKKIILVTGSSGQAGKAIAELLSQQYIVKGLDIIDGKFTNVKGSLNNWASMKEITKNIDAIVHTAALHAPHISLHSREEFIDTNIKGTLYLLEAAKLNGVKKLIYTSTTSLYGESMNNPKHAVWITERVMPIARDIYDITKLAAEELCRDFFDAEKLQTVSLRVSRFWDEPLDKKVFYRMYRGVDVRDVATAHKLALEISLNNFELFNVSAETIFNINDIKDLRKNLQNFLKNKYPQIIDFFASQKWEVPEYIDRVYIIDKAKKILGYQPLYNIDYLINQLKGEENDSNLRN